METIIATENELVEVGKEITKTEKELLKDAPDNIKALYLKIDFLCCKQRLLEEKLQSALA